MIESSEAVIKFWRDEISEADWYIQNDKLDQTIRDRFLSTWEAAKSGKLTHWATTGEGTLALIIVTDQFSRNMFRGDADAFSTDIYALAIAQLAIRRGDDLRTSLPMRQFYYMPLMHSESLSHQERSVRLFMMRMETNGIADLLHARAHRDVIRTYGRFPYRNAALGRVSTAAEQDYIENGGYGLTVRSLQAV